MIISEIIADIPHVHEVFDVRLDDVNISEVIVNGQPVIYRGAYQDKPLVQAGLNSLRHAQELINKYYNQKELTVFTAPSEFGGRFFYNADMTGMNFESLPMSLQDFFSRFNDQSNNKPQPSYYAGSTDLETYFPGLVAGQSLGLSDRVFENYPPIMSIWMGNKTTAATHFDMSHNIAACVAGHRRFTLFPPDQIVNLYPGPLSPTPAGQVVSMVDLKSPDFTAYPDFENALKKAQTAELNPGDVLIYPAMWWHQVEALDDFNILVNYWWNEAPKFMDNPMNVIFFAMLALRDRDVPEKQAWKNLFEYYVFDDPQKARDHLPEKTRGPLAPMNIKVARQLRTMLLNKLNR